MNGAVGFCLALTIANLLILSMNIKLYTEILKDHRMDKRSK